MSDKLSVIIPITGKNRKEYAATTLHFLNKQTLNRSKYEIILVEQIDCLLGGSRTGGPFYKNTKGVNIYIPIKDLKNNHFNQPWMANVGARVATGNKFLFLDIDIVCPYTYLETVSNFRFPYFIAWDKMYALNENQTLNLRKSLTINKKWKERAELQKSGALEFAGYSVCAYKNFFFNKLGGYNENFLGWGGNDNDIAWRALKILGEEKFPHCELFHQWHLKSYANNLLWHRRSIWRTTYKNPNAVTNKLKNIKVGNKNKQTYINLKDIYVDAKKEKEEKKRKEKQRAKKIL